MNIIKNLLIFMVLLAMQGFGSLNAQEALTTTVTGRVVDESGQPLPGVVVKSFNLKNTVLTDAAGEFSIQATAAETDHIVVSETGYNLLVYSVIPGQEVPDELSLIKTRTIDPRNEVSLPYGSLSSDRSVGAVSVISGEELESFPADNLLEALMGRVPGLVINQYDYMPGRESLGAYIRGLGAAVYIDGVARDLTGLNASDVERVEVLKDLSGRAVLGLSGAGPVIWITTKKGNQYNRKISVSAEYGFRNPTALPKYLDAYNYATLYNEARENDGLSPRYTQEELDAYRNQSNPVRYPDVDYYDLYVKNSAPFSRGNISFEGGDEGVNYYSAFNYLTSQGLESVGELSKNERYKLLGNVDIRLNDFMRLGVNISGSLNNQRFPNQGGGSGVFNMFDILSRYPANAHPVYFGDKLIISDNYPVNVTNELKHSGFAEGKILNAQNSANLAIDLNDVVEGLTLDARASFDVMNYIIHTKGGTEALYRLERTGTGADTAILVVPKEVDVDMSVGNNTVDRRTEAMTSLNYEKESGKHSLLLNAIYYMALHEWRVTSGDYQPEKLQDLSLRANYNFDNKYTLEADLSYTGSMRMPKGDRFTLFPTVGAAWIVSNESFLSESNLIDYLKLHTSFGVMGIGNFYLEGYNPYYLFQTLWSSAGSWRPGIPGNYADAASIYTILQHESTDFVLPKRRYFNAGVQGQLLEKSLTFELNYFNEYNYDKISNRLYSLPSLVGTEFLPAANYGEDKRWGFDGMVQYSGSIGDFRYSAGLNALYIRGKYLVVDELVSLEEYRKLAGKDMDLFWIYNAEGLYQSESEITSRNVPQAWGDVRPGDIRYEDKNDDGTVDEKDVYTPGAHSPRLYYGLNLNLSYKQVSLFITGQGVADGDVLLSSDRYFRINGTSQNYSELMLDRWPVTDEFPRLTTTSNNNVQNSTFWVRNAAYFKIKNVELSYRLPTNVSRSLSIADARVFLRGTNLLVLSGLNEYGVDPENLNAGITGYPVFRTYTAGVSFSF
ncbi:MAG TPA: SusC/RagA family TonB-linked outer membrane protein [Bacteroidetes bacterium]|nr:SusC/RagA family TonB-linked outer membrane protein [Bacteroidota bacterium]